MTSATPRRIFWLDASVAAAGGAAWGACFGQTERVLLPWVALVPLCWLLGRPRAPLLGLVHGTIAWLAAIPWIVPTLVTYGELPRPLAAVLFLLLALYLGSFHALFAWLGRGWWRRGGAAVLAGLPALWLVLEVLRSWLLSGFPWNLAGYAWIGVPGALPISAWIGAYGLSALVVLANAGIALAIARRRWEIAAGAVLAALLLLALGARWAKPGPVAAEPLPARILQPNTPILDSDQRDEIARAYQRTLRLTAEACDQGGALVLWPESAGWPFVLERDAEFRADLEAAAAHGCAILLNSPRFTDGAVYNTAFLLAPGGALGRYDKRHLVPFGEYVPLARVVPFMGALARNAGGFSASDRLELLRWRAFVLGVSICFEITFPHEVAELVREGASTLVTITNDAWYGDTSAPWQHLRAARFRAAENHRTVLRAALTGVSAWIAPDGALEASLGVGEAGVLRGEVAPRGELTLFSRAPWAAPAAAFALCLALWASAILTRRRTRARA